jgi:hypothetical protein
MVRFGLVKSTYAGVRYLLSVCRDVGFGSVADITEPIELVRSTMRSTTRRELAHITSLAYLPLFCC